MPYGKSDIPLSDLKGDYLDIRPYINGLCEFIRNCDTPMTIALQGDWGTGKTSFIHAIEGGLKDAAEVRTVSFSTWEYSRFQDSDDLYASFIIRIASQLQAMGGQEVKEAIDALLEMVATTVVTAGAEFLDRFVISPSKFVAPRAVQNFEAYLKKGIQSYLRREEEKAKNISAMKARFAEAIAKSAGQGGRVVIFVDDLDRLDPKTAVGLLEVIKLFMDVPQCVFALAIDYDVVVRGIGEKYPSLPEDKRGSFFDKIIQLPFRMPTEQYKLEKMAEPMFKPDNSETTEISGYEEIIVRFLTETLGPNPRTLKRLYNAYKLLSLVRPDERPDPCRNALLLVSLITQFSDAERYKELLRRKDRKGLQELAARHEEGIINQMSLTLNGIAEVADKDPDAIYEEYVSVLRRSSLTNKAPVAPETADEYIGAIKIIVDHRVIQPSAPIESVKDAFCQTFAVLVKEMGAASPQFWNFVQEKAFLKREPPETGKGTGYFSKNSCEEIQTADGEKFYLGYYSDSETKKKHINRLCALLKKPEGYVIWRDEENKDIYRSASQRAGRAAPGARS